MLTNSREYALAVGEERDAMQRDLDEVARALAITGRLLDAALTLPDEVAADLHELVGLIHVQFKRALGLPPDDGLSLEDACSPLEGDGSPQQESRAAAA